MDYYVRATHRADDPLAAMEAKHIREKGISISRTISSFAYMERRSGSSLPHRLEWRVTPPCRFLGTLGALRPTTR